MLHPAVALVVQSSTLSAKSVRHQRPYQDTREALSLPRVHCVGVKVSWLPLALRGPGTALCSWHPCRGKGLPGVGHGAAVPHAPLGVVIVEEVPEVDPLDLQTRLEDSAGESVRE